MLKKTFGLNPEEYNKLATISSQGAMLIWFIVGIIYNIYNDQLITLSTTLLIFPGLYIISFSTVPIFLVGLKILQKMDQQPNKKVWKYLIIF